MTAAASLGRSSGMKRHGLGADENTGIFIDAA
jgi:hypothetical protein